MNQIKALFFDVDGTLYTHRVHDFPISAKETLYKLIEKGYKIAIATSRCQYEMQNLPSFFQEFPFHGKIYDGGALVFDDEHAIHKRNIPTDEMNKLMAYVEEHPMPIRYSTYDGNYLHTPSDPDILEEFFRLYLNMPIIRPYQNDDVYNVLLYPQSNEQRATLMRMFSHLTLIEHSLKTIELTAQDVGKDSGVKLLCDRWNVSMKEIACFGDGANDIAMLKEAGIGIAMGNGSKQVQEAGDIIAKPIDEDGIYEVCKQLGFL